jgi:hypothetical protein
VPGCRQVGRQVGRGACDHRSGVGRPQRGHRVPTHGGHIVPTPTSVPTLSKPRARPRPGLPPLVEGAQVRVVPWSDPVADPHGLHPCSRYVELYWLPVRDRGGASGAPTTDCPPSKFGLPIL